MKRITTMLIAIAMICTFVGCSNNTTTSSAGSDTQTSVSDTTIDTNVDSVVSNTTTDDTNTSTVTSDENDDITSDTETAEPAVYNIPFVDESYYYSRLEDGGVKIGCLNDPDTDINAWHMIYPRELGGSPVLAADKIVDWPDQIVSVEFEDGYTRIPSYTLQDANGLISVILPNTVIEIEDDMCLRCEELVNVNIPDNIQFLGEYAFYGCEKIEATYRGETYTYDMLPQLRADIAANNLDAYDADGNYIG